MEQNKVNQYLLQYKTYIPEEKTLFLKKALINAKDDAEDELAVVNLKNPILVLLMSIFFGCLGVDRFIVGDVGLGVCKLLFGFWTCGIWPLVDIFFSYKKAKEKNLQSILVALN